MKLTQKIKICKVCFKEFSEFNMVNFFHANNDLCAKCLNSFNPLFTKTKIQNIKTFILYEYNDFLKNALYKLKGSGDIEIATIFLSSISLFLKFKYFGYLIVLAPSYIKREDERGFAHLSEIFKPLKKQMISPIIKISDRKQSDLSLEERKKIEDYIIWDEKMTINNKKILLVDDVITSGSTLNACLNLIKKHQPKKIQVLVISKAT